MAANNQKPHRCFGDIVWAKMGGYPFWPGKVKDPQKYPYVPNSKNLANAGLVKFYGSNDLAWVKWDNMLDYEENLQKFKSKSNKKVKFQRALVQSNKGWERKQQNLPETDDELTEEEEESPKPKVTKARSKAKKAEGPAKKRQRLNQDWNINKTPTEINEPAQSSSRTSLLPSAALRGANREDPLTGFLKLVKSKPEDGERCAASDSSVDAVNKLGGYIPSKLIPIDKTIGFLGSGIMAEPLAMCLIKTGHNVTVWGRVPSTDFGLLVKAGAKIGKTATQVVEDCDIIVSCFSDFSEARDMYIGSSTPIVTSMCKGKGVIEMTTMSSHDVIEIDRAVRGKGGKFLEAPFGGNRKDAEEGRVVILAAGDRSLYMEAHTCFEAMGTKTFFLGELGSAASTRLIMNMLSGTLMASIGEGMSLAEKAGLDQYTLLEVLEMSDIACPLLKMKGQAILEGHFPANYPLRQQQANMRLVLNMGDDLEQPLHVAGAANEMYKRMPRKVPREDNV